MFGWLKTDPIVHPELGTFQWSRGLWRGWIQFGGYPGVPLALSGTRKAVSAEAISQALRMEEDFRAIAPTLQAALVEHREPYMDDSSPLLAPLSPAEIMGAAQPLAVAVAELDGQMATEVCLAVPWEEEHILGARFRHGDWIELCGSTLVP